jgi:pimeloyl-ACP methyl ester carboxylesterase
MMKTIAKLMGVLFGTLLVLLLLVCEQDKPVKELIPLYTNSASQFMPLLGMQIHFRDEGIKSDSTPLLLLHGMSSSLNTWDSVVLYLKNSRRVISIDLPGFGLTGPSTTNTYNYDFYNTFLDSFTNKLSLKNFILVGNSMGGAIAWKYSLHHPQAVQKMILIDAAGYPKKNESGTIGFKIASLPLINNIMLYATPKYLIKKSLESVYYDQSSVTATQVNRYHDMAIREGNRAAALKIFNGSFATSSPTKPIHQIQTPTLILWGQYDNLISVENAYRFNRDIKDSKVEVYPNVGHVPMEEVPQKVSTSILKFVQ